MSPYVETQILPELRELGRGTLLKTGRVADMLGYSRRRVYDFFVEMEQIGVLVRKPGGKVWRLV